MNNPNKKIIFWGTPEFAVPSLKSLNKLNLLSLVITQPDRAVGRGKKITASPIKNFALANKIDILTPENLDQNFENILKKYLPATFVIVAYGQIISQKILDLSESRAINIHPSMLPVLRGPSPIQTALLKGFKSTGVTLMQLDKKMDHGPILSQIKLKIEDNDDYLSLSDKLSNIGADLLAKNIESYLEGHLTPLVQDDSQATYCQMIKKEDGRINWQKTAVQISNQIRAYRSWPGAYTKLDKLDIRILKVELVDKILDFGQIDFDDKNIFVGTGDKSIKILELQPAGKKIMLAQDFIRGYSRYLNKKFD